MSHFDAYRDSFPNARLTRSKTGVLEVVLHTNDGTLAFNGYTHEQFVDLFHAIGSDRDNRVVILTGSGNAFMETISPEGFDFFTPRGYDKIYREGRKVLMNILDIEAPLIAAVNGPMRLHTEYILLADIVLATPSTVFQDKPHFELGVASGDGVHLLWQEAIGTIRGRYFILTRQELDAQTAKEWGAVNEIVPADKLLPRAREIAEGLAKLPSLTTKYTRIAMTQKLRRIIDEGVTLGLALEGISAADVARGMVFSYRVGIKQRRITLGSASVISVQEAHRRATQLYASAKLGIDPAQQKEKARANAVETVKAKLPFYLARQQDRMREGHLRQGSYIEIERHLLVHAKRLHAKPLAEVTRRDVATVLSALTEKLSGATVNRVQTRAGSSAISTRPMAFPDLHRIEAVFGKSLTGLNVESVRPR
jgi:enoyl-CoA hydratase/carnithine racemase